MSLFNVIKKKLALKNAIKQVVAAREASDETADALFASAYQGFEAAIHKDLMISEALYNWGFALLHHAKTKSGDEAVALYQEAITKFSFCLTIDPDYLGAAIDGGVALMDLARLQQVSADHNLYASAKRSFEKANKIQKGSASYNLACVHSLCHDEAACLEALQNSKAHGSLPNVDDIMGDPDLLNVANKAWFIDFVEALMVIEPQLALAETAQNNAEVFEIGTKVNDSANLSMLETTTEASEEELAVEPEAKIVEPDNKIEATADNEEQPSDSFKAAESYK